MDTNWDQMESSLCKAWNIIVLLTTVTKMKMMMMETEEILIISLMVNASSTALKGEAVLLYLGSEHAKAK